MIKTLILLVSLAASIIFMNYLDDELFFTFAVALILPVFSYLILFGLFRKKEGQQLK